MRFWLSVQAQVESRKFCEKWDGLRGSQGGGGGSVEEVVL